jgi:hypothetical protein
MADLANLRQFQQHRSDSELRADTELVRIHSGDNKVFPERAWLQCQSLGPHKVDIGVCQQTYLAMPFSSVRVTLYTVLNHNVGRRDLMLGNAFLRRNANVQQLSISHARSPDGSRRSVRRT